MADNIAPCYLQKFKKPDQLITSPHLSSQNEKCELTCVHTFLGLWLNLLKSKNSRPRNVRLCQGVRVRWDPAVLTETINHLAHGEARTKGCKRTWTWTWKNPDRKWHERRDSHSRWTAVEWGRPGPSWNSWEDTRAGQRTQDPGDHMRRTWLETRGRQDETWQIVVLKPEAEATSHLGAKCSRRCKQSRPSMHLVQASISWGLWGLPRPPKMSGTGWFSDPLRSTERDAQIGFRIHLYSQHYIFTASPSSSLWSNFAKHLPGVCCRRRVICVKTRLGKFKAPPEGEAHWLPAENSGLVALILHPALPLPLARI